MKRGLIILGVAIVTLIGCKNNKYVSYTEIYSIDSVSHAYERPENPGTFIFEKDTIKIRVKMIAKNGVYKTKYKLLHK